jgi:3-oxoacyl-[acyl-carrier protein] reductase
MGTWLVTGASRGLGRQLARSLARRGHRVIAAARDPATLAPLQAEFGAEAIRPLELDLADAATVTPAIAAAVAAVGDIEGVINNAAIGSYRPFLEHSEDELLTLLQVNVGAVLQVCRAVLPALVARGGGRIINIASDLSTRPLANMAPYVASKFALRGLSLSLLREFKDRGVQVSLVQPGIIDTGFDGHVEGSRAGDGALAPTALAELIVDLTELPAAMLVDEITLHPIGQEL